MTIVWHGDNCMYEIATIFNDENGTYYVGEWRTVFKPKTCVRFTAIDSDIKTRDEALIIEHRRARELREAIVVSQE